ncbi:MAG: hypothetical protein E7813_25020 [Bradyrhizobium sp.]|uniref:hypothetical protein n=1 Tax=Bradyrhizobium sp. TaxID=376 RepID=UPI0012213D88|nr:hypothetical protein [Bradyrhizobium sp.]THD59174.1 MAG: hypothetical protein E7813_25020 [Bradyrhizobium sp.]
MNAESKRPSSAHCGTPLMSKAQRAAEAIAANPQMSDRAIAAELGVAKNTVRNARNELVNADQLDDDQPRVGLDGKQRKMPAHRRGAAQ